MNFILKFLEIIIGDLVLVLVFRFLYFASKELLGLDSLDKIYISEGTRSKLLKKLELVSKH